MRHESSLARPHGFSLLEVLIATTLLVVGVTSLASLTGIATRANDAARRTTFATLLAVGKMEQLRALTWGVDADGQPVTDTTTDLTVFPPAADGGAGLTVSPPDALARNTAGYCDFLDAAGRPLGGGAIPPAQSVFVRRWSIAAASGNPSQSVILQVRVIGIHEAASASPRPDEARLVTMKTRKAVR